MYILYYADTINFIYPGGELLLTRTSSVWFFPLLSIVFSDTLILQSKMLALPGNSLVSLVLPLLSSVFSDSLVASCRMRALVEEPRQFGSFNF